MELILILLIVISLTLLYIVFLIRKRESNYDYDYTNPEEMPPSIENTSKSKKPRKSQKGAHHKSAHSRKTSKMKWRNRMLDISMIPKSVELDKDTLLPQAIKREYGYGRRFNAFVLHEEDFFYHRSTCTQIKKHSHNVIHRYIALQEKLPCPKCTPVSVIDEWYFDFLKTNFGINTTYSDFFSQFNLQAAGLSEHDSTIPISSNDNYLLTKPE